MNKEKIIKKSEIFSQIISEKKAFKNKYFSIYYQKSNENNKYGITIPKKVGKANVRNKIKRQIKNIIMTNEKDIPNGFNYVIIIKEVAQELSFKDLSCELLDLIKKVSN